MYVICTAFKQPQVPRATTRWTNTHTHVHGLISLDILFFFFLQVQRRTEGLENCQIITGSTIGVILLVRCNIIWTDGKIEFGLFSSFDFFYAVYTLQTVQKKYIFCILSQQTTLIAVSSFNFYFFTSITCFQLETRKTFSPFLRPFDRSHIAPGSM